MTGLKIPIGLALGSSLALFGQTGTAGDYATIVQGGAVAVLGLMCYKLFDELKDNRKERTESTNKMIEAVATLGKNCAVAQANSEMTARLIGDEAHRDHQETMDRGHNP